MKTKFLSALLTITLAATSISAYGDPLYDEYIRKKEDMREQEIEKYQYEVDTQKTYCENNFNLFSEPQSSAHFSCIVFYQNNDFTAYDPNKKEISKVKIKPENLVQIHLKYLTEFKENNIEPDIYYRENLFFTSMIFFPEFYLDSYPEICFGNHYKTLFEKFNPITRAILCSQILFINLHVQVNRIYQARENENLTDSLKNLHVYMLRLVSNNMFEDKIEDILFINNEFSPNDIMKMSNLIAAKLILAKERCIKSEKINDEINKINKNLKENFEFGSIIDNINEILEYFIQGDCRHFTEQH